jgi:hypothetical protein
MTFVQSLLVHGLTSENSTIRKIALGALIIILACIIGLFTLLGIAGKTQPHGNGLKQPTVNSYIYSPSDFSKPNRQEQKIPKWDDPVPNISLHDKVIPTK